MINLLPSKEKRELSIEKNIRITVILGSLAMLFLVCLSLLLLSINIFIVGGIETQKILFDQRAKELETFKMQSLQKDLVSFNKTLGYLDDFYGSRKDFVDVLKRVSDTVPDGVILSNLSLNPKAEGDLLCNLSGFSRDRETLLKFKENLEKEGMLKNINFPPASWVKPADINFSVSFGINDSE